MRSGDADACRGLVSLQSPVGRAMLGRRPGDELVVQTPGGVRRLTIMEIVDVADAEEIFADGGRTPTRCAPVRTDGRERPIGSLRND